MKKFFIYIICLFLFATASAQKMMKPSIMVVPGDAWCLNNGFMQKSGDETYPNYGQALLKDPDLNNVISKINIVMADRGFPLENLVTTHL